MKKNFLISHITMTIALTLILAATQLSAQHMGGDKQGHNMRDSMKNMQHMQMNMNQMMKHMNEMGKDMQKTMGDMMSAMDGMIKNLDNMQSPQSKEEK